jgi:Na+/H+ antiporter NhaC
MIMRVIRNKYFLSLLLLILFFFVFTTAEAQCSICTRTAQQLGEKPAKGLNFGILYLALTPYAIVGVVVYRWWKSNRNTA